MHRGSRYVDATVFKTSVLGPWRDRALRIKLRVWVPTESDVHPAPQGTDRKKITATDGVSFGVDRTVLMRTTRRGYNIHITGFTAPREQAKKKHVAQ